MHLGSEDIDPIDEGRAIVGSDSQFFGRVSDRPSGGIFPGGILSDSFSADGNSIEIKVSRIIIDHIDRDLRSGSGTGVGEFFPEIVSDVVCGIIAVQKRGLHPGSRDC